MRRIGQRGLRRLSLQRQSLEQSQLRQLWRHSRRIRSRSWQRSILHLLSRPSRLTLLKCSGSLMKNKSKAVKAKEEYLSDPLRSKLSNLQSSSLRRVSVSMSQSRIAVHVTLNPLPNHAHETTVSSKARSLAHQRASKWCLLQKRLASQLDHPSKFHKLNRAHSLQSQEVDRKRCECDTAARFTV